MPLSSDQYGREYVVMYVPVCMYACVYAFIYAVSLCIFSLSNEKIPLYAKFSNNQFSGSKKGMKK